MITVVPHKEEEQPQQPVETKEEEKTLEKPEYLENKFWDEKCGVKVEELNNSYKELQNNSLWVNTKLLKEYDVIEALEDVDDDDELKQYFVEWAKENKPTQVHLIILLISLKNYQYNKKRQKVLILRKRQRL